MLERWTSATQRRWAFWLCLALVLALALAPPSQLLPSTGWDKANHVLAFTVLALLGCASYPARLAGVLAGLLVYGALIEVLQTLTGYRSGEWLDLVADGLGLLAGWQLARRMGLATDQARAVARTG